MSSTKTFFILGMMAMGLGANVAFCQTVPPALPDRAPSDSSASLGTLLSAQERLDSLKQDWKQTVEEYKDHQRVVEQGGPTDYAWQLDEHNLTEKFDDLKQQIVDQMIIVDALKAVAAKVATGEKKVVPNQAKDTDAKIAPQRGGVEDIGAIADREHFQKRAQQPR